MITWKNNQPNAERDIREKLHKKAKGSADAGEATEPAKSPFLFQKNEAKKRDDFLKAALGESYIGQESKLNFEKAVCNAEKPKTSG